MSATTQAGDWHAAKMRGARLPEHELEEEVVCDHCNQPCDPRPKADAAHDASGLIICTICLEDMIYAHQ